LEVRVSAYETYKEGTDEKTVEFQTDFLCEFLSFLERRGIRTAEDLATVRGRKLLTEPLWKLSEANLRENAKHNLRFFSEQAHLACLKTASVPTSRKAHGVEHEHIIPRRILEGLLLRSRSDRTEIARLVTFAVGCIVTVSEHQRLAPDPWGDTDPTMDPWRRYRGQIEVWDRKRGDFVDLERGLPA
jgi:hypothetical protein